MSNKTRVLFYGKDNDLNIFGDYTTLEFAIGGWSLVGPRTRKELNPDEVNLALENMFFQRAWEK